MHLIPLKDQFDQQIIPTEANPLPFSARFSCAPCHEYAAIRNGLHFNAATAANPGRAGEPWVWVDEKTGTLLPLSYRKWAGAWDPAAVGLTPWDFTLLFGRHMAGGGVAEPDEFEVTPGSRWEVSGRVEINCLGCHNGSNAQDQSEWAKQILRENFGWAATAAAKIGEVGGMASRVRGTWDIYDGPNPDDTEWAVPPYVRYDRGLFDSKHRALLDIVHKPSDDRCLACHAAAPVAEPKYKYDEDVHSAAGLGCVSCHRNDLSHAMVRGYEGEALDSPALGGDDFTCAGCHLGDQSAKGGQALSGRLGAPYPKHKGFPAVHFKRLSCTVCHSGPWPAKTLTRVRTSRANRLGIFGIARWWTDLPAVVEPVYLRDRNGKLTPSRLLWPAFWAEKKGRTVTPIKPEAVVAAAGSLLNPQQRIVNVLTALSLQLDADQTAVLVKSGKVFEVNVDGGLNASAYTGDLGATEPAWAAKQEEKIISVLPEFDPAAEEIDTAVQDRLQKLLDALAGMPDAPGKPVLIYQKALFKVTETYLEKTDNPGPPAAAPRFAWAVGDKLEPLVPEFEMRTTAALAGLEQTLTEEQVALVLKALQTKASSPQAGDGAEIVYFSGGRLFRLNRDGRLDAENDDSAEPVTWPLAHEVRPARQSLGVNGCTDCHRFGSAFLFRKAEGTGPLLTSRVKTVSANAFMGLDRPYQKLFGLSFAVRPLFKWALFLFILVIGSIVALVLFFGVGRLTGLVEKRK
ncbi:MAG: hypothetical protein A2W03_06500 [Candidatus Aminicenantes bacterium RBG_16_63_16]|nr:MAG: hypothetical protein A2W03_06500 [Candidatus Aminicenantes bacterium RBG_16_63_16]